MKDKNRLIFITVSVLLPQLAIFVLAIMDIMYANQNIEIFARLYVEHFTGYTAEQMYMRGGSDSVSLSKILEQSEYGNYPTYAALFARDGEFICGSENLRTAAGFIGTLPVSNDAREAFLDGGKFTISRFPVGGGEFWVAGAVSWRDMPGIRDKTSFLWQILVVLMTLWSIAMIVRLVQKILRPISKLEKAVSSLKWGYELLDIDLSAATPRVRHIGDTLLRISFDVKKSVDEHRSHMNDMVNFQEDERTKISRDIHDGPLQDVTALIQRIRLARRPDSTEEDQRREFDLAEKIAFETVKEMRALCNFLNPPWLELGLSQALTELTERQAVQYGVKIFLGVDEDIHLSDAVTLTFFRVVQEAVTNSVKHGEAGNIWIDISKNDGGGVTLTIQDDGHGFDTRQFNQAELRAEGHRGLSNMDERMSLAGGRLRIISYKGEGTCVRALLP